MKFFIPLGFNYGGCWHLGSVHGPFTDQKATEAEIARRWPNDKKAQFIIFDGEIVNVEPSSLEKPESEKREPGDETNYIKNGDGWKCKDCGATILAVRVAHPVWIRGMSDAGTGECRYSEAPYCPNCEKKPSSQGAPVYAN